MGLQWYIKWGIMGVRGGKWGKHKSFHEYTQIVYMEEKILYKEESYELIGIAYAVYNSLGYGHHERVYGDAYQIELRDRAFLFKRERCTKILHKGKEVGTYFLDFLVKKEHLIVVELKVGIEFHDRYKKQVLQYLHATGIRLGIIFLFTPSGVEFKRIVL